MFLRFDCGCIGYNNIEMEQPWVFRPCDNSEYSQCEYSIFPRNELASKGREKLTAKEVETLFDDLRGYVVDGHKFREIRSLLR